MFGERLDLEAVGRAHLRVGRDDAPQHAEWVADGFFADERPWVEHRVAADLDVVADESAEFFQAGGRNGFPIEAQVRAFDASPEVGVASDDRVAEVDEVGGSGAVEQDRVLDFGAMADDAVTAEDGVRADVGAMANRCASADDARALDEYAGLNQNVSVDGDELRMLEVHALRNGALVMAERLRS